MFLLLQLLSYSKSIIRCIINSSLAIPLSLKHRKNVFQSNVGDIFLAFLKLEVESGVLFDFHIVDVKFPGQY